MKVYLFVFIYTLMSFSCKKENKNLPSYNFELKDSRKDIKLNKPHNVEYEIYSLHNFMDSDKEYLSIQNGKQNAILFYDLETQRLVHTLNPESEGPNGVGNMLGFYNADFENIYVTTIMNYNISVLDTLGKLKHKISYKLTDDSIRLTSSYLSTTHLYQPIVFIGDKMYITQADRIKNMKTPASIVVDTTTHTVTPLPFYYPELFTESELEMGMGSELSFSRCYDGRNFIYSFFFCDDIFIVSPDHKNVRRVVAKSRYIDKLAQLKKESDDMLQGVKRMCEIPMYGNLIYDKYRSVYYRFSYPETEMEVNENFLEIWKAGRKKFSVIILDKDLKIIGETLFPEYIYRSNVFFINKNGLYIANDHFKNPHFEEDTLSFVCLKLTKNQ